MYHSDETRFYETDDSRVTRRLLKEKSKLTFVDVLNKDIHCMFVEGKSRTVFFLQTLLFTAFLATAQIITYVLVST